MVDINRTELVECRIDEAWGDTIGRSRSMIFTYNRSNAEDIFLDVDLRQLGGLVVECTSETYTKSDTAEIKSARSVIDLAFGAPARLTSTTNLLRSSYAAERLDLAQQLSARRQPNRFHGTDETWLLPSDILQPIAHLHETPGTK